MKQFLLFSILILGAYSKVFAQTYQQDTLPLTEVKVVTSSKIPLSIGNVTQKIDVISNEELKNMVLGNRNISDALRHLPGMSVSTLSRNDANWGTYGGIGPKYSTYMLNGLPVDAFIDGQSLDISYLDRIEVQRGPASVLYPNYLSQDFAGNQSPLGGTVNLILKNNIKKPITTASLALGSYNTLHTNIYHEGKFSGAGIFAGADYEKSDYTNYGTDGSWLNMKKNPEYYKAKVFGGLNYRPGHSDKQSVSVFMNHTVHEGDAGRVYRGYKHQYTTVNAGYELSISNALTFKANAGLRAYDRSWQESNFGVVDTLKSNNGAVQRIVPVDVALIVKHGNKNNFIAGADYQNADYHTWSDPLQGYHSLGNKANATQTGIYAQEEIHFSKLLLRGGIRLNTTTNNIALINGGMPGQPHRKWNSFIWNLGAKLKLNEVLQLYANAGNSFVTPGLKSVGGTINLDKKGVIGYNGQLPNPNLKAEEGFSMDGGADISLQNKLTFGVRGFYTKISDAIIDIVVSQNPSQSQSVNAGNSNAAGVEIQSAQRVNSHFRWFANFVYVKTRLSNKNNTDEDGAAIPFSPEIVANAGFDILFPFGLSISPSLNYNDGYYDSNSLSGRKLFRQGALVNMTISQNLYKRNRTNLELFGQLYNLTNNRFEMPWQFRDPGFSFMAGIRAGF